MLPMLVNLCLWLWLEQMRVAMEAGRGHPDRRLFRQRPADN